MSLRRAVRGQEDDLAIALSVSSGPRRGFQPNCATTPCSVGKRDGGECRFCQLAAPCRSSRMSVVSRSPPALTCLDLRACQPTLLRFHHTPNRLPDSTFCRMATQTVSRSHGVNRHILATRLRTLKFGPRDGIPPAPRQPRTQPGGECRPTPRPRQGHFSPVPRNRFPGTQEWTSNSSIQIARADLPSSVDAACSDLPFDSCPESSLRTSSRQGASRWIARANCRTGVEGPGHSGFRQEIVMGGGLCGSAGVCRGNSGHARRRS